jgi:polyhydroxybutyrate depolymerase
MTKTRSLVPKPIQMKKQLRPLFLIHIACCFSAACFAQPDSIFNQGVYRTFILHLPTGYNPVNKYPLVINLHGLNSDAAQQQNYSQFNSVANTSGFIVVYPNAVGGNWSINGTTDVNFISALIDSIRADYSCNSCLFVTGMSQGGFLTYRLACSLPQTITAVAVVSGNMSQNLQSTCVLNRGLPVMHFHGTADGLVNYNGTVGIAPVETTISWWVNKNNCNPTPVFTAMPDITTTDNSTVEKYYYGGGANGSEVTFYKILNGGHTWPGAAPVPIFGATNYDINASALIGTFFNQFCTLTTSVSDLFESGKMFAFPNPAVNSFQLNLGTEIVNIKLFDVNGRIILNKEKATGILQVDCSSFPNGMYLIQLNNKKKSISQKILISH